MVVTKNHMAAEKESKMEEEERQEELSARRRNSRIGQRNGSGGGETGTVSAAATAARDAVLQLVSKLTIADHISDDIGVTAVDGSRHSHWHDRAAFLSPREFSSVIQSSGVGGDEKDADDSSLVNKSPFELTTRQAYLISLPGKRYE